MSKKNLNLCFIVAFSFMFSATVSAETFFANLSSAQEVPASGSTATGYARLAVNETTGMISYTVVFNGLSTAQTGAHFHAPGAIGVNAGIAIAFTTIGGTSGTITGTDSITPTQISQLRQHLGYVNVHSTNFPGGEIRGQLGVKRPVDFDGDGRQDFSVLKYPTGPPSPFTNWSLNSTTGATVGGVFGDAQTDFPTPGDFDGDGKDDLAYYRDGTSATPQSSFWIFKSSNNTLQYYAWGRIDDIPVARDYDGDGITDVAVFRRGASAGAQAVWYIRQSSTGTTKIINWGTTGASVNDADFPIPGDYDGDGKFDAAVYRSGTLSPTNTYIILRSSDGAAVFQPFGNFTTDYVVPGDYDGDGKFDYAIARAVGNGAPIVWWILQSSNGQIRTQTFGVSSGAAGAINDVPAQGDYDGDGRTDIAVYRVGTTTGAASTFWVLNSLSNTISVTQWGVRPDFAIATFDVR